MSSADKMPRIGKRLSAIALSKLPPGIHSDGLNLYLQVSKAGNRSWLFRYMRDGRARGMGLGPLHTISLAEAREKALSARKQLVDGNDPLAERRQARREAKLVQARAITFHDCAVGYVAMHSAGWRNKNHRAQWSATLEAYVYPIIGALPVAAVDTALTLQCLEPLWHTKTETASRVRGRIEAVLDWASARGYRSGENPARWRGHLDKVLPRRSKIAPVRHHAAMPYRDIPAFVRDLRMRDGLSARALELTILTASRTSEVTGAQWQEFDPDGGVWIVPAERMKAGRAHRVPLADRSTALVAALPRLVGVDFLFPGVRRGQPISNAAMHELLKGMRPGLTVHGFRSSFRDWAAEQTSHPREIAEAALAHVLGDKAEAAYWRSDALEKRRALMADWAAYCGASR